MPWSLIHLGFFVLFFFVRWGAVWTDLMLAPCHAVCAQELYVHLWAYLLSITCSSPTKTPKRLVRIYTWRVRTLSLTNSNNSNTTRCPILIALEKVQRFQDWSRVSRTQNMYVLANTLYLSRPGNNCESKQEWTKTHIVRVTILDAWKVDWENLKSSDSKRMCIVLVFHWLQKPSYAPSLCF